MPCGDGDIGLRMGLPAFLALHRIRAATAGGSVRLMELMRCSSHRRSEEGWEGREGLMWGRGHLGVVTSLKSGKT